ncbi:hypothetical protein PLESTB_000361800 [Pleodorina starrii]|uniref:Uncharacterized protein n=1 Tax=Pleodorina starrii TaxID=330485 RepID=A0A9W6EYZ8_9CHLO|nr:hypothetical protein PLESTM_000033400 [Pleodorina starrii]GLC50277.1 hypothetical protein PLESTB_000361800 [Pleodorina starrii]GLC64339.1 hypothetical protein PLESTF_000150800 [Pleodorina starrii]
MQTTMIAGRRMAVRGGARSQLRLPTANRPVVARVQPQDQEAATTSSSAPTPSVQTPAPQASSSPRMAAEYQGPSGNLTILGTMQEAINGRAAMLGFVAALVSEAATHQAVWSQIAGRYAADGDLLEAPLGTATLLFGAVVGLTTMATLVPKLVEGLEVDSRSFGPFTPGLEKLVGRVAQMGFAGLLVVELVKGSALLG